MSDTPTPQPAPRLRTPAEQAFAKQQIATALSERGEFLELLKATLPYVELVERQLERASLLPLSCPPSVPGMLRQTAALRRAILHTIPPDAEEQATTADAVQHSPRISA